MERKLYLGIGYNIAIGIQYLYPYETKFTIGRGCLFTICTQKNMLGLTYGVKTEYLREPDVTNLRAWFLGCPSQAVVKECTCTDLSRDIRDMECRLMSLLS